MTKTTASDAYDFVWSIIDSCENEFHFHAAGILVELFKTKYPEEKEKRGLLVDWLADKLQEKFPPPPLIFEA